jgi:hypothetical protein
LPSDIGSILPNPRCRNLLDFGERFLNGVFPPILNPLEQSPKAHPAQVAAVIPQGPKSFCAATMGTLCWWPHPFVETFGDILFWINIDGVNELHYRCHPKGLLPLLTRPLK